MARLGQQSPDGAAGPAGADDGYFLAADFVPLYRNLRRNVNSVNKCRRFLFSSAAAYFTRDDRCQVA